MERRNFFAVVGAWICPLVARAQEPQKQRRIALVHSAIPADQLNESAGPFWVRRFFQALRGLGYEEGRNLVVDRYSAEGRADRFATVAEAVVSRNPDVIVTNLNILTRVFKAATTTIPIVAIVANPVQNGLVTSLARPGGNVTGVSIDVGFGVFGKALQILKEAIPSAAKIAYLSSAPTLGDTVPQPIRDAADKLGVALIAINPPTVEGEIRRSFDNMAQQRLDAVLVGPAGNLLAHRALVVELATKLRLPAMY